MKFHQYLQELRKRRFQDTKKMCTILGISKDMWRKLERGINPPPQKSVLKKFCVLVNAFSYEENQLYTLAKKWEPHEDTSSANHKLMNRNSSQTWVEALLKENRPDYEHKYWKNSNF